MNGNDGNHNGSGGEHFDPAAGHPGRFKDQREGKCPATLLSADVNRLIVVLAEEIKAQKSLKEHMQAIEKQTLHCVELERTVAVLAEENRKLREHEIDAYFVLPIALSIIGIIDRQSAEISDFEQQVMDFDFIERCRKVDRAELLDFLATLGIEPLTHRRGEKFDTRTQTIGRVRPTVHHNKFERVHSILRPGYWRRSRKRRLRKPDQTSSNTQPHHRKDLLCVISS